MRQALTLYLHLYRTHGTTMAMGITSTTTTTTFPRKVQRRTSARRTIGSTRYKTALWSRQGSLPLRPSPSPKPKPRNKRQSSRMSPRTRPRSRLMSNLRPRSRALSVDKTEMFKSYAVDTNGRARFCGLCGQQRRLKSVVEMVMVMKYVEIRNVR